VVVLKKNDLILIGIVFILGLASLFFFRWYENSRATGNHFANVYYRDQMVLRIDLETNAYIIPESDYEDDIDVGRADEGIFYVPGSVSTDMELLYENDTYAAEQGIEGIKLEVEDEKIAVVYQESPKDLCQLQPPTDSELRPLVCLPNELYVEIVTHETGDEFVPDSVLE
jgi:hypothetical protein